jgi:hypothetical protein
VGLVVPEYSVENMQNKNTCLFYCGWCIRVACLILIVFNFFWQLFKWDIHHWFETAVVSVDDIRQWNESYRDEHLHELSRWDGFNASEWRAFVQHSYAPVVNATHRDSAFRFLEVGVGVGAWARVFMQDFPNATGEGIDLEPKVVAIAQEILSPDKFQASVLNMILVPEVFRSKHFDYLFIPGTLCYADNIVQVYNLIKGIHRQDVIRAGGKMGITMLASLQSNTGSCVTRIPKSFWASLPMYTVIDLQEMDDWSLPHSLGRYAVFLEAR